MIKLTLTAKRQATFPKQTCEALGIKPGDTIELEPRDEEGRKIWILRPEAARKRDWVGCLANRAGKVSDHTMEAVRKSIAEGRKSGT